MSKTDKMLDRIEKLATRLAVMKRHDEETQNRVIILGRENEALREQIVTIRGAMAADDQRLRNAEERVWPGETRGCDAPDAMADEIVSLRQQLAEAKRTASDEFTERQVLTVERLRTFVGKVRLIVDGGYITMTCQIDRIIEALAELDAKPAPVAETAEGGT